MPYDERRIITVLFAFTIIIHNVSGVYGTWSNDSCKYCKHFFRVGLIPNIILKRATDVENSPGNGEGNYFVQRSSQEKMEMNFVDYCNSFCKNTFQISGSSNRDIKLRPTTGEIPDEKILNKFHSKKRSRRRESVEGEKDFLKNPQQSINGIFAINLGAAETGEKVVENFKIRKEAEGDTEKLYRKKRGASHGRILRNFRKEIAAGNGYEDPTYEDHAFYKDDYKLKRNDGYNKDHASREELGDVLYDDYFLDKKRRSNDVGDEDKLNIKMNVKSFGGEYFSGEIAEAPERRIWHIQEFRRSNEGKSCKCNEEFEKYMNVLLKGAFVLIESSLKQLSKWLSYIKSISTSATSVQSGHGNLMKTHEGPKEKRRESMLTCDFSLGFTHVNNFFYPPGGTGNKESEIILTGDSHKVTETPIKKAAEIEELLTEGYEEGPLAVYHTTEQVQGEERGTTPEPEGTTDFWTSNYVTLETTTNNMEIFPDATAMWTEPGSEFTESSTVIFRQDENNLTVTTRMKTEGITQTNPTAAEGNTIQPYAKPLKDAPVLCNLKNLEKPQFLPLILEALKYGRH